MNLFFKDNQRRKSIISYLEAHGVQTLHDIKEGFRHENQTLPFSESGDIAIHNWLNTISGIETRTCDGITEYFLSGMMNKRKNISPIPMVDTPAAKKQMRMPFSTEITVTPTSKKRNENPQKPHKNQNFRQQSHNCQTRQSRVGAPHLYGMPLIGDENFLNMAVFDMKFEKEPRMRIRQSGGCVSGLRISDATHLIQEIEDDSVTRIIVNVGSVDVAEGRNLIDLIQDMRQFLNTCRILQIIPILTTLAPLPSHQLSNKRAVHDGFNKYIRNRLSLEFPVIDLHKCLLRPDGSINFNLYQAEPRFVSGSRKAFTVWNKPGRIRVYNMLVENLGLAIIQDHNLISDFY